MSRPENSSPERVMRTCETCGVGLGTMAVASFVARFVAGAEKCPYCGGDVIAAETRKEEAGAYIDLYRATERYKAHDALIRAAVADGAVRTIKKGNGVNLSDEDLARVFELREAVA